MTGPGEPARLRVLLVSRAGLVASYQGKVDEMARQGVEPTLVVPPHWRTAKRVQRLEAVPSDGVHLAVEPVIGNGSFHLHWYPRLRRRFRGVRPHLLHVEEEPYNLATFHATRLARRAGVPVVGFTWQNVGRRYPPPFSAMERQVLAHTDLFLAGNEGARSVLRAKGYRGAIEVVPQVGVDPVAFCPSGDARLDGDGGDGIVVGYAGRLVPEKGVDVLIRAVAGAERVRELRVVGSGPERAALEHLAAAHGLGDRLTVREWIPSSAMPDWYRSLDVFVLPSRTRANWTEQFGRVLIEAMASGVPVVGTASGEIPNVLGDAGVVVDEDDVVELRAALVTLASDPSARRALGARGRDRVMAHYTQARIAAQTVAAYRAVVRTGTVERDAP